MSVSAPFITRPIATSLLAFATIIGGWLGYFWLPVSSLPQVDFPTIQVSTQLPGANPQTMSTLVTASLEREFGQIPALTTMTSTSSYGLSQITLQFNLGRDIDAAAQDVQSAINAAGSTLPRNLPYPPTYAKVNPADAAVVTLALTSDIVSMRDLSDLADTLIAQRLSMVTGVGHVSVEGGIRPAVRIQADVARLASYGLSHLRPQQRHYRRPTSPARRARSTARTRATPSPPTTRSLRPRPTARSSSPSATPRRCASRTWRTVEEGLENARVGGWYQGTPAVIIDVQRQPGANVIETVDRLKAELPRIERALPKSVKLTLVHDRTDTIRASIHDVQFTLVLSVVLIVMVVLRVPALRARHHHRRRGAAGVADRHLRGDVLLRLQPRQPVADGADHRHRFRRRRCDRDDREHRAAPREEAPSRCAPRSTAPREIGFTVISLTMSLIAVFIPLLFMTGLVGRMFREFALTLTIAVVVSAIVSLTLTPMMAAKLLKHQPETRGNWIARAFNWVHGRHHRGLPPQPRMGAAPPAGDARGHGADAASSPSGCTSSSRRAFCPRRTPASSPPC